MKRKSLAVIACLMINVSFALQAEEIQIGDITDGKVTLIGRLGKPLGTVETIEGQLISDPKQVAGLVTAAFRASKVDGKPLEKGQIIGLVFRPSAGTPALHANQLVKLSGFEGGAFVGTPDAAREAMSSDASPLDWKFQSTFRVISLL